MDFLKYFIDAFVFINLDPFLDQKGKLTPGADRLVLGVCARIIDIAASEELYPLTGLGVDLTVAKEIEQRFLASERQRDESVAAIKEKGNWVELDGTHKAALGRRAAFEKELSERCDLLRTRQVLLAIDAQYFGGEL